MAKPSKRIRLSSPTFDDQVQQLSQGDIHAFDSVDPQLSQSRRPDEDENPFCSDNRIHALFKPASAIAGASANAPSDDTDPSDEAPPEVDYAAWFNSDPSKPVVGFNPVTTMSGFQRPSVKSENAKPLFLPSAAALREAEEKMRKWQEDDPISDQVPTYKEPDLPHSIHIASPPRATFSSARNALQAPETPTPASFSRSAHEALISSGSHTALQSMGSKRQVKPFRSPLFGAAPVVRLHQQVSTPSIDSPLRAASSQANTAVLPLRPSSAANHATTQKPLGFTPRHAGATARPKFVTPFKTGVKYTPSTFAPDDLKLPPTPSRPSIVMNRIYPPSVQPSPRLSKQNNDRKVFDLTPPSGRRTLATSGLRPQAFSAEQLEDMGINFRELSQVNLRTAPFYAFATQSCSLPNSPHPSSPPVFGRSAMLEELSAKGCVLAKQAWVDNHWPLVLWKLAGMVALDPMSESDPLKKRWCWPEVIRQFMYRYERDLNGSSRPPLRLITVRDASAESSMVLCISDIIWPGDGSKDNTAPVQTHPELEVTDGWYRLRARIDAPLARAVRKGKIKIGRKLAVASAKLLAERKDGCEVLEAYNSNVLLFTGNSTHLAPWHTKLGFQRGPIIATLNSLTADGGNVAIMMLTVIKTYPVAYIEFVEDATGQKQREGPHDAKEELKLNIQWKTKRESHASRLWSEYEKRRYRLLDYAERLEQRVGSKFKPGHDDSPPDKIYDIYDTLREDVETAKNIIPSIDHEDAGWLAQHIREKAAQERDEASKQVEQELESTCPPRDVKAFCVVVVRDTRTHKYPSERTAQVTIWDAPGVSVLAGCTQSPFLPGQQYLVTNLVPTQASAWMDSSGEVYLTSRRNSKWTLIN